MSLDPDIERVNPYSNLNSRVTAPEGRQERRQKRRNEDHHAEEPEDVLDLRGEEEGEDPSYAGQDLDLPEADGLDISA